VSVAYAASSPTHGTGPCEDLAVLRVEAESYQPLVPEALGMLPRATPMLKRSASVRLPFRFQRRLKRSHHTLPERTVAVLMDLHVGHGFVDMLRGFLFFSFGFL